MYATSRAEKQASHSPAYGRYAGSTPTTPNRRQVKSPKTPIKRRLKTRAWEQQARNARRGTGWCALCARSRNVVVTPMPEAKGRDITEVGRAVARQRARRRERCARRKIARFNARGSACAQPARGMRRRTRRRNERYARVVMGRGN